jgi:CBS-domain-containing membrane protein
MKEGSMSDTANPKPLPKTSISKQGCHLLDAFNPPTVHIDSPASQVMTDLAQVPVACITANATLDDANRAMMTRGVRMLLVVNDNQQVAGLMTTVDILGEKPVLVAQSREMRRHELRVSDVMVSVEKMDALAIEDVKKARVGHIVATLKADGRAHAIVVGQDAQGRQALLGIFSASQIARQLGLQVHTHEMARTFAEIEAVIAGV